MPIKKSLTIFVVDQSQASYQMIKQVLKAIGFTNIHHYSTGEGALASLQEAQVTAELVMCGDKIEDMASDQFIALARNVSQVPIVMVTENAEQSVVLKYVKAGANSFIVKPFTADAFIKKITTLFK